MARQNLVQVYHTEFERS